MEMEQEFLDDAQKHPVLGPNYFVGRKIAREFIAKFETEQFKPLIENFARQFEDKVWGDFLDHLLSDTETNLSNAIWRRVDICIEALMTGKHWAMERYALQAKYGDGENIRKAVARHVPFEIIGGRIADLEKENADLKKSINTLRGML
jgi:hypothetical protein